MTREIEKPARQSLTRAVTGWKYTDPWSYKNISNLLCKAVNGMTTKQLRVALGIAGETTGLNSYSAGRVHRVSVPRDQDDQFTGAGITV